MLTKSATNNIQHAFIQLGMTDEHADVYIAVLELGSSPPSSIAKAAKIPRTTTYDILEQLADWGFIVETEHRRKKHFVAADPERLEEQMIFKRNRVTDITYSLKKEMYQLEMLYSQHQDQTAEVSSFQGDEEIEGELVSSLTNTELLRISGGYDFIDEERELPEHLEAFHQEIRARRIKTREIHKETEASELYLNKNKANKKAKIILLPSSSFKIPRNTEKIITERAVLYVNHKSKSITKIADEGIIASEREQFELIWDSFLIKG